MGTNHHTAWAASVTNFSAASMNPAIAALDKAITYHKVAMVSCDGTVSWSAGTLTWSGTIHIYFTREDGTAIHNSIASGSIALADDEFCYVTLSETNDTTLTMAKAAIGDGSESAFKNYNVLVMGFRNAADDQFYPEELSGVFARMVASGDYVEKTTFNANTILKADSDNTPEALEVAEDRIVGRLAGGEITALTAAEVRGLIACLDGREQQITSGDSVTVDFSNGATAYLTLDRASTAITLSGGSNGKVYRLRLVQDATGGRAITWSTTVRWRGGAAPTITTDANAEDWITLVYSNGNWYGDIAADFAAPA